MACECELQNTLDVEVAQDALLDVEIGGSAGVLLQAKSVEITANGTSIVAPDDGFDGLSGVEINTNVPKRFECGDATFVPPNSTSITLMKLLRKIDLSCWDTSRVTSIKNLFNECFYLQSLDVSGWDTSRVTDFSWSFRQCLSLQSLDVSGWDTSSANNIGTMFFQCPFLQLDVSNWNTSRVNIMSYVFGQCRNLSQLDLSGWNASSATTTNYLFYYCLSLKTIIGNKTMQDVDNGIVALKGIKVDLSTSESPLRFSSILALANGLADLAGGTAKTLTISKNSYNNMYNDDDTIPTADVIAERKARIAAICAAKNWNFAH